MAIMNIFSKRQRRRCGDVAGSLLRNDMPRKLKVQVWKLIEDSCQWHLEEWRAMDQMYKPIVKALQMEYGVFSLVDEVAGGRAEYQKLRRHDAYGELIIFFFMTNDVGKALDVVEIAFGQLMRYRNHMAGSVITELNGRFRESDFGYEFSSGQIVCVDSQFVHDDVVKPALAIVDDSLYRGVQEEFLRAHEHYRSDNYKEALNECLKAFESMMKTICDRRKWDYGGHATARKLIATCIDNGLVPLFWKHHFSAVASMLESGIPTARNKLAAHGQGATPVGVPRSVVGYTLHMTACAIVFLEQADGEGK